ncbi:peptidylprolyl isomerase [Xinfangfangia pollutisoli]|uniref:peptidylprolyl isomerase n=1 Tax=Xinfangfangia pollutisoli TaxID=2865960 RepID=UPI001CD7A916|nr:peptidylprolyl isomerase [Xinfangfangia pollutisoli]
MLKQLRLSAAVALVALTAAPVFAEGETSDTVVATVNGTEITLGQMIALRENLPQQYLTLPDDVLFKGILDQLVQQEVLAQSVTALTKRDEANITNDKRGYLSGVVIAGITKTAVTDEALQKAYDERFKDAAPQKEYHAAHILVKTEDEAKALKAQLDGGANFAELAKANSIDTGSGAQGGDLGWFGLGMMVKPFEDAVIKAEIGKITDPVQTDFGWHLILVSESRIASKPSLDDLREELAQEVETKAIDDHLKSLTEAAKIEKPGEGIDPALLKDAKLID